jgi:hypothetical protein
MAHHVTMCEFYQGITRDKQLLGYLRVKDFNEWTQRVVAVPQLNCTHSIFHELDVPKDDGETVVFWNIQSLYKVFEELLHTN